MTLDLDDRQRAMLQEMDVHVWWPKAVAETSSVPLTVAAVPAVAKPVPEPQKSTRSVHAIAIESIANKQALTGTSGIKSSELSPSSVSSLSWANLQQAVAGCQACKLCEGRKNTVFGVGPAAPDSGVAPQVDWLIVGEGPGENEDRTGEPFVGQAGQLLDNMLKAMGASRQTNTYILNVVKCRPPGNRNPELAEIAQCEPFLRRQIELLQPKVILAMGRFAVNALLQSSIPDVAKLPLGKLRGQVHGYDMAGAITPVIATYHPAYLLRNLPEKAKAWADLCLAMDAMKRLAG
jgi:uracil-DNA glycosylase family 4